MLITEFLDLAALLVPERTAIAFEGKRYSYAQLRKEGITNPTKPGGHRLYSEEQVRQIPSLIAEMRRCDRCGKPRPLGYRRFCKECSQYRKRRYYSSLSPEEKAER
jgi:hypothetical protein